MYDLDEKTLEILAAAAYTTTRFMLLIYIETIDNQQADNVVPSWEDLGDKGQDLCRERVEMIIAGEEIPTTLCFGFRATVTTLCQILGIALKSSN